MNNEAPELLFAKACHPERPNKNCSWSISKEPSAGSVEYRRVDPPAAPTEQCYWCKHPDHGEKVCPAPYLAIGEHGLAGSYPCGCSHSTVIPAAPGERDKALARQLIAKWKVAGVVKYELMEVAIKLLLATVRAEGERNFINNVAAVLDTDDVETFTAQVMKAKASPDLNGATRSALKSEAEIRAEAREAMVKESTESIVNEAGKVERWKGKMERLVPAIIAALLVGLLPVVVSYGVRMVQKRGITND